MGDGDNGSNNRTITTSVPSLRSDLDETLDEKNLRNTGKYGLSIIEILTKSSRFVLPKQVVL